VIHEFVYPFGCNYLMFALLFLFPFRQMFDCISNDYFYPHPFQFIIHLSFYHPMLYK